MHYNLLHIVNWHSLIINYTWFDMLVRYIWSVIPHYLTESEDSACFVSQLSWTAQFLKSFYRFTCLTLNYFTCADPVNVLMLEYNLLGIIVHCFQELLKLYIIPFDCYFMVNENIKAV